MKHNKDGKSLQDQNGYLDIGCSDLAQAENNRLMVKEKQHIEWWLWFEKAITKLRYGEPLPSWVPTHNLPQAGGSQERLPDNMHELEQEEKTMGT